eukprot:3925992-Pleurochrysis_carterae.AAC.1
MCTRAPVHVRLTRTRGARLQHFLVFPVIVCLHYFQSETRRAAHAAAVISAPRGFDMTLASEARAPCSPRRHASAPA